MNRIENWTKFNFQKLKIKKNDLAVRYTDMQGVRVYFVPSIFNNIF